MPVDKKISLKVKDEPKLALVGNPNTGKSLVFNYLTNQYVTVSNYPGTTVEITKGIGKISGRRFEIVDTPGTNSLLPQSEDETVTRRLIINEKPEIIVQVIDSKNLKRSLNLTQELADLGIPLILDLNMSDEAKERGIKIDAERISQLLGVKTVRTIAITKDGLSNLKSCIISINSIPNKTLYDNKIEEAVKCISSLLPIKEIYNRFISLAILAGDEDIYKLINLDGQSKNKIGQKVEALQKEYPRSLKLVIQEAREKRSKEIVDKVVSTEGFILKKGWQDFLSGLLLKPITAIPLTVIILYIMYKFVGEFAAGSSVDFLEEIVFGKYIVPWLKNLGAFLNVPFWIDDLLFGEYGIISMAITYALAIIFPIVTAFFIFFGILEDSGYLPRLCVLLDRLFHPIGLNGRAVLPFVLGLGCDTMATLTARTLDTKKERIIATLILALAIPCSAQLGVIMGMLGAISGRALSIWLSVIILSGFGVGMVVSKIIPGKRSLLIQEIPPIRIPQLSNVILKTWVRLKWYLKEAVPLFVLGTVTLFVLNKIKLLALIERTLNPLVTGLLSLPQKATEAFLIGFLRRDYGAAGLYMLRKTGQLDDIQALISLIVITLFVPCIAQFFVMVRERGAKVAFAILLFTFIFAFVVGGVLNFTLRSFMF